MFKKNVLKKIASLFLASAMVLLGACAGDDGAPGPKGDAGTQGDPGAAGAEGEDGTDAVSKLGYFQGTVSGHRQDGTAFSESFSYEYVYGNEVAEQNEWLFQRFETASAAIVNQLNTGGSSSPMNLDLDKGYFKMVTAPEKNGKINPYDFYFSLSKGISNNQLFRLNARPYLNDRNYEAIVALSPEQNAIYKFQLSATGALSYGVADLDGNDKDDTNYAWRTTNSGDYYFYYDIETGELVRIDFNSEIVDDAALIDKYNDVKLVWHGNEETGQYVFVKTSDGSPLYEEVGAVPADPLTITNYKHEDGVISFDFSLVISKYRGFIGQQERGPVPVSPDGINTTAHEITITGKFSTGGKYYTEEVGRKKG
jgi:hypothetical protein